MFFSITKRNKKTITPEAQSIPKKTPKNWECSSFGKLEGGVSFKKRRVNNENTKNTKEEERTPHPIERKVVTKKKKERSNTKREKKGEK